MKMIMRAKKLAYVLSFVLIFSLLQPFTCNITAEASASTVGDNFSTALPITSADSQWDFDNGSNGYYKAQGNVVIDQRVMVNGNVNLILTEGCQLIVPLGITVTTGNSLTISSEGKNTGKLIAGSHENSITCDFGSAAIGGDALSDCGDITINGGDIFARSQDGAAIGAGVMGNGGTITINEGIVNAVSESCHGIGGNSIMEPGTFNTSNQLSENPGSSVIYTNSIGHRDLEDSWSAIIFIDKVGKTYNSPTLKDNLNINNGESLTIPEGQTLTVKENCVLTLNGGTITNNGVIYLDGTFVKNSGVYNGTGKLAGPNGDSDSKDPTPTPTPTPSNNSNYYSGQTPDVNVLNHMENIPEGKFALGMDYLQQYYSRYAIYQRLYMLKYTNQKTSDPIDEKLEKELCHGDKITVDLLEKDFDFNNLQEKQSKILTSIIQRLNKTYGKNSFEILKAGQLVIKISTSKNPDFGTTDILNEPLHFTLYGGENINDQYGICCVYKGAARVLPKEELTYDPVKKVLKFKSNEITSYALFKLK